MKAIIVLGFVSFLIPVFASACPDAVRVEVQMGQLKIDDKTDSDFAAISGIHFVELLKMQATNDGCLFVTAENGSTMNMSVSAKHYLYVHETTNGEKIQFNGYTPHGKLFEIRTTLAPNSLIPSTPFIAGVFDASGPAKEMLGQAVIQLSNE